jgi:predicted RNA binding protein YcfA (HicA-like mRNA interferase family)
VSPALSDLPIRKLTRVIESLGFVYVRTKGSHAVYRHPDGRALVIPQHATVKRGTLGSILPSGKRLLSSSNCSTDDPGRGRSAITPDAPAAEVKETPPTPNNRTFSTTPPLG